MNRNGESICNIVMLLLFISSVAVVLYFLVYYEQPTDPRTLSKLDAVKYLNEVREAKNQPIMALIRHEKAPPVQFTELNVARWRAEYLARTAYISSYDREGRHPLYWYTRLDGGLYAVEEVVAWLERASSDDFKSGIERALIYKSGSLLNPCYNYVAMESSYRSGSKIKFYVIWMIAKWINWTSPPLYEDGMFTAEGYAHPVMKPVAFVVRYSPFVKNAYNRLHYSLGDVYYCKYLDPPAGCKDAAELNGTVVVSKVLDSGDWYIKIDVSVQLNKTGIYTFELIAQDLRKPDRKCSIMQYAVEVKK